MAVLFRPKHTNQFGVMARVGHSLTFAVGANERPLWVDCGPSVSGRQSAAVGGNPTFAEGTVKGEGRAESGHPSNYDLTGGFGAK